MPVKITGLEDITKKLNQIHQATSNMEPIFKEIGNMIKNEIEYNFEKESGSDGIKWKDTKQGKRAKGGKVLNETSRLNTSFTDIISHDGVEVGTDLPYARIHQFGGKAGRNKKVIIPKRSFMPLNDDGGLDDKVSKQIMKYLASQVG